MLALQLHPSLELLRATVAISSILRHATSHQRQLHTTGSSQSEEEGSSSPSAEATASNDTETSTSGTAEAEPSTSSVQQGGRPRHVSLDDPLLNIYLRYNTKFMTDPDREHKIGQLNAFEKKTRLELRKALAAHRLQLRDSAAAAAAGAGRRQPRSLRQQMNSSLASMQDYMATVGKR